MNNPELEKRLWSSVDRCSIKLLSRQRRSISKMSINIDNL